jgi:hypothetical protein
VGVVVGLAVGEGMGETTGEDDGVGEVLAVGGGPISPEQAANATSIIQVQTHRSRKRFNMYFIVLSFFPAFFPQEHCQRYREHRIYILLHPPQEKQDYSRAMVQKSLPSTTSKCD